MRRTIVVKLWFGATVLMVALVTGGCTARQSREQYDDRVQQAATARAEVTRQLEAGTLTTMEDHQKAAHTLDAAVDELNADPPPRDARAAHEPMVNGLEAMSALVLKMGRCRELESVSRGDARACRQAIEQTVFDDIRNDFDEANTIYREKGYTLPGTGGAGADSGTGPSGANPTGGDEL